MNSNYRVTGSNGSVMQTVLVTACDISQAAFVSGLQTNLIVKIELIESVDVMDFTTDA